jgi:hypothetical protein
MTEVTNTVNKQLSGRDRDVIDHVARYRLTTFPVLRRTRLRGLSRSAAGKIIGRLCNAEFLQGYPLIHPTRYFVLGSQGAKSLGIGTHRTLPLGPQSLPMEYASLVYATLGIQPRQRLSRREILALCPWLPESLAAAPHCFDETHRVLELLRVDLGGPADHVARKCLADINARRRLADFSSVVRSGKLRLVIITSTADKASALRQAIDRHDWPMELPIHFSIVPDLLSLTARKHDA